MKDDEVKAHNFIIIADGHVPTQNDFMRITGLKRKLEGYDGTIMAIGTGAMNAAEEAYILPQLEGEAMNNEFMRFTEGLGLTKTQVIPHYDDNIVRKVDGLSLRDRILFDSKHRKFLGLPDGSYLMSTDGVELIYGRYYKIADRQISMEDAGFLAKAFA
jgi:dipeptidase E